MGFLATFLINYSRFGAGIFLWLLLCLGFPINGCFQTPQMRGVVVEGTPSLAVKGCWIRCLRLSRSRYHRKKLCSQNKTPKPTHPNPKPKPSPQNPSTHRPPPSASRPCRGSGFHPSRGCPGPPTRTSRHVLQVEDGGSTEPVPAFTEGESGV